MRSPRNWGWGVTAMVYFGGHAIRYQDRNFLLAVDSKIVNEADIRAEGIDIDLILDPLIVSRPAGAVVILDAARKNPWQQALSPRLRGLSSQPPIQGVTVVYPVAPGEVVGDAPRDANLFAVELIKLAKVQGLPFREVLKRVRTAVAQATRDKQMVWESSPAPELVISSPMRKPVRAADCANKVFGTRSRAATAPPISRPTSTPIPQPLCRCGTRATPADPGRQPAERRPAPRRPPLQRRRWPRQRPLHHSSPPSAIVRNVLNSC